jgi:hypothetical protein
MRTLPLLAAAALLCLAAGPADAATRPYAETIGAWTLRCTEEADMGRTTYFACSVVQEVATPAGPLTVAAERRGDGAALRLSLAGGGDRPAEARVAGAPAAADGPCTAAGCTVAAPAGGGGVRIALGAAEGTLRLDGLAEALERMRELLARV